METSVTFISDGLKISATISLPDGVAAAEKRPAFLVLHGFGSTQNAGNVKTPCAMLTKLGYVTLRFDMRGCGDSEGEKGRLICLEQVEDTKNALTFLAGHANVEAARIGVIGSSFGAAVAVYTAGVDKRVAACISASGWGNGETKFKAQHGGPGEYEGFLKMLAKGREHKARTGLSLWVDRYAIVPIPAHLRVHVVERSIVQFPAETAQSMFDFRAEDVIAGIAPRPCLLLHSAVDTVTPTRQSIDMFAKAGSPTELHLFSGTDHFMLAVHNVRVHATVQAWLKAFFPVHPTTKAGVEAH